MHHELLQALAGYPGNAFIVSKETGLFEVVPGLPFIHPSEVSLLNRICRLGTHYLELRNFISEQSSASLSILGSTAAAAASGTTAKSSSLYLKALACGIDDALDGYRKTLVAVEQKCMKDPHLPLSHMQSAFEPFQLLLPSLTEAMRDVRQRRLRGGQLLTLLHQHCSSGVPLIQSTFERVLACCHVVLYKQLSAWMLHGLLLDERGEFFIEKVADNALEDAGDGNAEVPEETQHSVSYSQYAIRHALAPSYIPLRVHEKVLFVGEAVQIFQTGVEERHTLSTTLTGAGSKLRSDQFRFGRMLAELQGQPLFSLRQFESTIDTIRDCVAEHLWKLLVEDSNLVGHLQILKEFFLLGRGELFLTLVDLANSFMTLLPSATTQHDVNVAFQQAMLKVGIDDEELMKQFKLTVTKPPSQPGRTGINAWLYLGLSHSVNWPLHILFTPAILEKYDALFKLLLALRRSQMALQQTWALLMQHRRRVDELSAVWQLRTHMGFLIDNLQYYVQVDVLETQFSLLVEKIRQTHDFETIKHAHETFVTTLQSQLFLLLPAVSHCLNEILELCNNFSSLLRGRSGLVLSEDDRTELDRIAKEFQRQSSLFFKIVSSAKDHHSVPHLAQLLLRIDYNKFFSTRNPLHSTPAPTLLANV